MRCSAMIRLTLVPLLASASLARAQPAPDQNAPVIAPPGGDPDAAPPGDASNISPPGLTTPLVQPCEADDPRDECRDYCTDDDPRPVCYAFGVNVFSVYSWGGFGHYFRGHAVGG